MSAKFKIGIDLGGTNINAGIIDENNKIIANSKRKTMARRPWQEVAADMVLCVKDVVATANITLDDCTGIGVGCPGTIDATSGVVVYANNFKDWANIPLGEYLTRELGVKVKMSNDANCAALGEFVAGAAKKYNSTVLITLGTGVGGGVVFNDKIFEGGMPGGAELGHTVLIADGAPCTCGVNGCWEAYSSATALIREATKAADENPESLLAKLQAENDGKMNGIIPFKAARSGDKTANTVISRYIELLGMGIVNMVNIFRPEVVLISGGICGEGEYLTNPLNEHVKKYAYASTYTKVPLVMPATLGNDAGVIGAASL